MFYLLFPNTVTRRWYTHERRFVRCSIFYFLIQLQEGDTHTNADLWDVLSFISYFSYKKVIHTRTQICEMFYLFFPNTVTRRWYTHERRFVRCSIFYFLIELQEGDTHTNADLWDVLSFISYFSYKKVIHTRTQICEMFYLLFPNTLTRRWYTHERRFVRCSIFYFLIHLPEGDTHTNADLWDVLSFIS